MNILDTKTDNELLRSLLAEVAKATAEMRCAKGDLDKAQGRLQFSLAVVNEMLNREKE